MLLTFHRIVAGCEEGGRESWEAFISAYTPIAMRLLTIYAPQSSRAEHSRTWQDALRALTTDDFACLRSCDHQSEREFLVDLRGLLLTCSASSLDPAADTHEAPEPAPATLRSLLDGLPLIHQVVAFLKMAGYSDRTLEDLLTIGPSVIEKATETLRAHYAAVLARDQDSAPWPAAWLRLLGQAWAAKTPDCAPLRQFVRILDGQTGWYEKEPVEKHVAECLHCLERWATLREIAHWKRRTSPLPAGDVEAFLGSVPLKAGAGARKSLLKRMFG